ncbi:NYN domain-containing protein, partial [Mycetocola sp.]|uniref:NYN domain-containing protein n=1 Tax=Mycetocola sp. TaxID=1871042 RepID=UPI00398A039C
MAKKPRDRVAVYIDFDNIVISRYNQLHGDGQFAKDRVRHFVAIRSNSDPVIAARIRAATVDVAAILDYASSFGSIVISRAYADWSTPFNASDQKQLIGRAVDLTQLFPTAYSLKNGADIRLAVDVIEDSFRLKGLTHVVIVAGDSDYIPLAQRCKRLDRYVVGIGVSGATSSSLAASCDEYADYDNLPGVEPIPESATLTAQSATATDAAPQLPQESSADSAAAPATSADPGRNPQKAATTLLKRAMELLAKNDLEWQHASAVKVQMKRMEPSFQERPLGHSQFSEFLRSRQSVIEIDKSNPTPLRLRLKA